MGTWWSSLVGESTESSPAGTCLALLLVPFCFSPLAYSLGASDRPPNALRWLRGSGCLGGACAGACRGARPAALPELIASDTALLLGACILLPNRAQPRLALMLERKARRVKSSPRGRQQELGVGVLEVKLFANSSRCVSVPAHRCSQAWKASGKPLERAEKERG